jgi:hypothetical protein
MNKDCLVSLQQIKRSLLEENERADNRIRGSITLNPEVRRHLNILLGSELVESQIGLQGDVWIDLLELNHNHDGQVVTITLDGFRPLGSTFIGPSWAKLLNYNQNLTRPPKLIYLFNSNEIIDEGSNNHNYNSLHQIAWILEQLKENADYSTGSDYVFLHHQKVEIPLNYDEHILSHSIEILTLKLILEDEHHKSAKKSLFKSVICEMLGETKKELRFKKLISEFDVFTTRFALAFHSYVTDYSFDKIRKEFEEKRTEYIQKVNNAFQDIASKLIVMPAPLWLALSQSASIHLSDGALNHIQLYKNITIIVLIVAVSILLGIMIWGQFKVLNSIKIEYTNLFARLQSEFPEVKLDSEHELKSLSNRHSIVYIQLIAVQIINMVLGVFAVVIVSQNFN